MVRTVHRKGYTVKAKPRKDMEDKIRNMYRGYDALMGYQLEYLNRENFPVEKDQNLNYIPLDVRHGVSLLTEILL